MFNIRLMCTTSSGFPLTTIFLLTAASWASPERGMRVLKFTNSLGDLERTVYLPSNALPARGSPAPAPDVDGEDDGFVLVSDSSKHRFKEPEEDRPKVPESVRKKVIKRRRVRKKPAAPGNYSVQSANTTNFKDPKFLNLFTLVRFGNEDCGEGGICYHNYECNKLGGFVQGPCAKGFGVCCALEVGCGETTGKAQTLFVGDGARGACTLTVEKMSCAKQMRLDFYDLQLEAPVDGNCLTDRLLIAGQNPNSMVPLICGTNSGQHMHFDVDEVSGPLMVSVISSQKSRFRMKVSQLCDDSPVLAPKHCLQYYTETQGLMESFNYQDPPYNPSYMNNMNYAMCIKKGPRMCSIVYSTPAEPAPASSSSESMESLVAAPSTTFDIRNQDLEGDPTVPEGEAGAEVFNCPEDYLVIGGVRLCGQRFNDASYEADFTRNAPVVDSSPGPFMVNFVSSPSLVGRGFRVLYQQQPC